MTAEVSGLADDAAFVERLRTGDERAFEQLFLAYGGRMLRVARRILRNEEEARDAVQDAFISAFRSICRFEGASRLTTWLHRIVVNACLMRLRGKRGHEEVDIEPLLPKFKEDGHQVQSSQPWRELSDAEYERIELKAIVRGCIDRLPETYRTIVLLRDVEELSTEEAAEALGISVPAAKVRLHRARQALRTLLDPTMRGEQK